MKIFIIICIAIFFPASSCNSSDTLFSDINQKKKENIFWELAESNKLPNMPKELLNQRSNCRLKFFMSPNGYGKKIIAVFAIYKVKREGEQCNVFVFNDRGICVLSSKDRAVYQNGGLLDFNGDGNVDKLVGYIDDEKYSEYKRPPFRFKIYDICKDKGKLILDAIYNFDAAPGNNDRLHLNIIPTNQKNKYRVELDRPFDNKDKPIKFNWSEMNKKYLINGPESDNFKILFP